MTQLKQLSRFSLDLWVAAYANAGEDVYQFLLEVDLEFPGEIFPALLPEYLEMYQHASKDMRAELWRLTPKIDYSFRSKVRLYKDANRRLELREQKLHHQVPLRPVHKVYWESMPKNFACYKRDNAEFPQELSKAKERANRYRQLGCESMASQIDADLARCQARVDEHGFHEIYLLDAVLINAKQSGMVISQEDLIKITHPDGSHYLFYLSPAVPPQEWEKLFDHFMVLDNKVLLGERDGMCYYISEGENYETLPVGK